MARRLKWEDKPELWIHCAKLYRQLGSFENVELEFQDLDLQMQFGIDDTLNKDLIRRRLIKYNLIESSTSSNLLPSDVLRGHHRGLGYLARSIGAQVVKPSLPTETMPTIEAWEWHGFSNGKPKTLKPKHDEERKVHNAWTRDLNDPRQIPHYSLLVDHLQATDIGQDILKTLNNIFEQAVVHKTALLNLQTVLDQKLIEVDSTDGGIAGSIERIRYELLRKLHSTDLSPEDFYWSSPALPAKNQQELNSILRALRESPVHVALTKSWKSSVECLRQLQKELFSNILIYRLIQEGTCTDCDRDSEITRLTPATDDLENRPDGRATSEFWPRGCDR